MVSEKIKDVIMYIALRLGPELYSRMKIIKLLFLIDFEAMRILGRKITGAEYIYHFYGPYSQEIIYAIHELEEENELIEDYDAFEGVYRYIVLSNVDIQLKPEEKEIIDSIIDQYGEMSPSELKRMTYKILDELGVEPGSEIL